LEFLALALPDEELRSPWMENAVDRLSRMVFEARNNFPDGGALYHTAHSLLVYRIRRFGPFDPKEQQPLIPPVPKD